MRRLVSGTEPLQSFSQRNQLFALIPDPPRRFLRDRLSNMLTDANTVGLGRAGEVLLVAAEVGIAQRLSASEPGRLGTTDQVITNLDELKESDKVCLLFAYDHGNVTITHFQGYKALSCESENGVGYTVVV